MTNTFEERKLIGKIAENKVMGYLLYWNIQAQFIGQETWLPGWVHNKLRFNLDDSVRLIKHFPDIATEKALIQVKSSPSSENYSTVFIEEASYQACKYLNDVCNIPVLAIWYVDNKNLIGNWITNLITEKPNTPREKANGSHTPFLLVKKENLYNISKFKDYLK